MVPVFGSLFSFVREYEKCIRVKMGSGRDIHFKEDWWHGDVPLKVEFNGIYNLVVNKVVNGSV